MHTYNFYVNVVLKTERNAERKITTNKKHQMIDRLKPLPPGNSLVFTPAGFLVVREIYFKSFYFNKLIITDMVALNNSQYGCVQ